MVKVLTQEALEARRAYQRQWNAKNRDKRAEYEARHWEKVARQAAEKGNESMKEGV